MNSVLENGLYYHVYNRGVEKRVIFNSASDYLRFIETIIFYSFYPSPRKLSTHLKFNSPQVPAHLKQFKLVSILCFCLMPSHFHLLVRQESQNGISEFIRKALDSYTKYFNIKYKRVGPLFQGKFKAKLLENDEYLLQVSKYIHRNPLDLCEDSSLLMLSNYPYSSYNWYIENQKSFCESMTILEYFSKQNSELSYKSFVEENDEIGAPEEILLD